jgi:hypothetical protein
MEWGHKAIHYYTIRKGCCNRELELRPWSEPKPVKKKPDMIVKLKKRYLDRVMHEEYNGNDCKPLEEF